MKFKVVVESLPWLILKQRKLEFVLLRMSVFPQP